MPYDLVIKNGMVVDGSGLPRYRGDVAVRHGRIAADRPHPRARARGDRRRRPGGGARLRGRPHPHGRAGLLGPARHLLVLARRHQRGDGQLRLHPRPVRQARAAPRRAQPRARRGHRRRGHGRGHRVDVDDVPGVPRPPSTALPKGINYAGYIGHSALRTYAMGERAFEQAATEDDLARHGARAARRHPRRRHRLHHLALAQPRDARTAGRWRAGWQRGTRCGGSSASWAR